MEGRTLGALLVQTESDDGLTQLGNLTTHADGWQHAKFPLTSSARSRISFEGYAGASYEGDIAIDDVSIVGCKVTSSCGQNKFACNDKTCVSVTSECDFQADCSDGSDEASCPVQCTFEDTHSCGWYNDPEADLTWDSHQGPTDSSHTGPEADHTKNNPNGTYMYVEASFAVKDEQARLVSPPYTLSSDSCKLNMFAYMLGEHIGSLVVNVMPEGGRRVQVFNETGDHGKGWKEFNVKIGARQNFQVELVAIMGDSYKGDIAIDDLAFKDCAVSGGASITSPPEDTTGIIGTEVQLTCKVSGNPYPTISWLDPNSQPVPDSGRVKQTGDHGSILSITDARLTDSGLYVCIASSTKNTVQASAHVVVEEPPHKCPAGRSSEDGMTPCSNCKIGTYQDDTGQTTCKACPSGQTTDVEGSSSLSECHEANKPCVPGSVSQSGLQPCASCAAGNFQDGSGQKVCKQCKANTYQDNAGSVACKACPDGQTTSGQAGSDSKDDCKGLCPPGQYSSTGSSPGCKMCDKGSYQNQAGQLSCVVCPGGNTTDSQGSTSEAQCKRYESCPPGSYNPDTGYTPCRTCSKGYYSEDRGAYHCTPCSGGSSTEGTGSTSPDDCTVGPAPTTMPPSLMCDPGSFSKTGRPPCTPCAKGSYQPGRGQASCLSCDEGQITDGEGSEVPGDCHKKPDGQIGGLSTGTISVIAVIGGIVMLGLVVGLLLFARHRRNAATPRLVLNDSITATDVGYGAAGNVPRGFMNPMYDDSSDQQRPELNIELEETNHGVLNPAFQAPSDV